MIAFEHKNHPLLPFRRFLFRVLWFFLYALLIIIFSVAIGTAGYHHYGRLPWVDSFYNACMILTGMGPVNAMNTSTAKLFASFYALYSGIAFLTTIAVLFAPIAHRMLHILHIETNE
jgi:hypothetical protein